VQDDKVGGNVSQDISVVFCMDISGSMCVTQAIQGKHKLKGDNLFAMNKDLRKFGDGSDQFFSAADKNKTYVSRLQCVQAAIDQQIKNMASGAPERKVGIVTFNNEVEVIGDAQKDPQKINGDHLMDYQWLEDNGKAQGGERLNEKVGDSKQKLI